jgi:carbon storage regulator
MLVLTRKLEQSVVVGGDIVITVLAVEGSRVRLGISAPEEVPIRRGELAPLDARRMLPSLLTAAVEA